MKLNFIFYPKPQPSYTLNHFNLEWFDDVPCFYIQPFKKFKEQAQNSQTHMIYFHGNAEDIGYSQMFVEEITNKLNVNSVAIEYPSYGVYTEKNISQQQIEIDAETVVHDLMKKKNIQQEDLIIFGRSLGSGPACYIATKFPKIKCLILMSAYTSLKDVAYDKVPLFSWVLKNQFPNLERSVNITCPTLLIHGKDDPLINCSHSDKIFKKLQTSQSRKELIIHPGMTHNDFHIHKHLIVPITNFLQRLSGSNESQDLNNNQKVQDQKQYQGQYHL